MLILKKMGGKKDPGSYKAVSLTLGPREGHGFCPPRSHWQVHEGQEGGWKQSGLTKGKLWLSNTIVP